MQEIIEGRLSPFLSSGPNGLGYYMLGLWSLNKEDLSGSEEELCNIYLTMMMMTMTMTYVCFTIYEAFSYAWSVFILTIYLKGN